MTKQPTIIHSECVKALKDLPENHYHSIITDPPYGIRFGDYRWGTGIVPEGWAEECYRVLKPGGHLLAFGAAKTYHKLAIQLELAGFEIRDSIAWIYGNGYTAQTKISGTTMKDKKKFDAEKWEGWGHALVPSIEPIVVARKPISEPNLAENLSAHETGAYNLEACRTNGDGTGRLPKNVILAENAAAVVDLQSGPSKSNPRKRDALCGMKSFEGFRSAEELKAAAEAGVLTPSGRDAKKTYDRYLRSLTYDVPPVSYVDSGGASRFFYIAKPTKKELPNVNGVMHPTVKPISLMRHLCKLVTAPGGRILDTFAGSGTTIEAGMLDGYEMTGIEMDEDFIPLIEYRVRRANTELEQQAEADNGILF